MDEKTPDNLQLPFDMVELDQIRNLPPDERGKYYERFFYNMIHMSSQKGVPFRKAGLTAAQIKRMTRLPDNTVDKYLNNLFLKRKVYRVKIGNIVKYFPNGRVPHALTDRDISLGDRKFRIYQIANPDGDFIYVQEKELDENGFEEVVGGITIPKNGLHKILEVLEDAATIDVKIEE